MRQRIGRKQHKRYQKFPNAALPLVTCLALSFVFALSNIKPAFGRCSLCYVAKDNHTDYKKFDFRYFESLTDDRKVPEAQAEISRLFPPGSNVKKLEIYLTQSKAKCFSAEDYFGPALECRYKIEGFFFVYTEWTVVARLDRNPDSTKEIEVSRGITGL